MLENQQLKAELQAANDTASVVMALNTSLGKVVNLIGKSYSAPDVENITELLFDYASSEELKCIVAVETNEGTMYFSNLQSTVSDKEKELIQKANHSNGFVDFNDISIIAYPYLSVLFKNMPIDNKNKYAPIKKLVPLLLGSFNEKIASLNTANELYLQSETITRAFNSIEESLDRSGGALSDNARGTTLVLSTMLQDLSLTLPGLGLEEDQEEFILNKIECAVNAASELANASEHIATDFNVILNKLHEFIVKQESLLNSLEPKSDIG